MGVFEDFQKKAIGSATGSMGRWYSTTIFFAFLVFISKQLDQHLYPYLTMFFAFMMVVSSLIAFKATFKAALTTDASSSDSRAQLPPPPIDTRQAEWLDISSRSSRDRVR